MLLVNIVSIINQLWWSRCRGLDYLEVLDRTPATRKLCYDLFRPRNNIQTSILIIKVSFINVRVTCCMIQALLNLGMKWRIGWPRGCLESRSRSKRILGLPDRQSSSAVNFSWKKRLRSSCKWGNDHFDSVVSSWNLQFLYFMSFNSSPL